MRQVLVVASLACVFAIPAHAGECDPVFAALTAQAKVPYASNGTMLLSGQPPVKNEVVVTGEKMYVRDKGAWKVGDHSTKLVLERMAEDRKTVNLTCEKAGAEPVGGQAATAYVVHEEKSGNVSDSKMWIANTSGLPLKLEMRFSNTPFTNTIEYRYDNIVAPTIDK